MKLLAGSCISLFMDIEYFIVHGTSCSIRKTSLNTQHKPSSERWDFSSELAMCLQPVMETPGVAQNGHAEIWPVVWPYLFLTC